MRAVSEKNAYTAGTAMSVMAVMARDGFSRIVSTWAHNVEGWSLVAGSCGGV